MKIFGSLWIVFVRLSLCLATDPEILHWQIKLCPIPEPILIKTVVPPSSVDRNSFYSQLVVFNWGDFLPPRDICQCLQTFMVVTIGGVLLATSGWRPWTLLNILQRTGKSPTTQNHLTPNVISAKAEKSYERPNSRRGPWEPTPIMS